MFDFTFDDFPTQQLAVERAEITLFAIIPPWRDTLSLSVKVVAEPKDLPAPAPDPDEETNEDDDLGGDVRVDPVFYTDWLEIPLSALNGKGIDLLDGYRLSYDVKTEKEDGFDQFPGAIQNGSHGGFTRATMTLTHQGGSTYRVQAEGETEFGWTFRIDTEAQLTGVGAKSGRDGGDKQPAPEVEDWFARYFDTAVFPPAWSRKGSDDFNWQVFEAAPVVKASPDAAGEAR